MTRNGSSPNGASPPTRPILHQTWYKFVEWHNLCTYEGPIRGDVYCLGKSESGKSSWLDGDHATYTCGHDDHMAWNSASDPTRTRSGRSLRDIILWINDLGVQRPEGGIVYFAVEYSTEDGAEVYSVGFGARCRGAEHAIHRWGFILPKQRLKDLSFVDDAGDILDEDPFAKRYGASHVFSANEFRVKFAQLFMGAPAGTLNDPRVRDHIETFERFLDMGKSYTKLTREGKDVTDLIRKVLPDPDPEDYERARAQMERIKQFDVALDDLNLRREDLSRLDGNVQKVRSIRNRLLRMDAFRLISDAQSLQRQIEDLRGKATAAKEKILELQGKRTLLSNERESLAKLIEALEKETDFKLLGEEKRLQDHIEGLRQEDERLANRLSELADRARHLTDDRKRLSHELVTATSETAARLRKTQLPEALRPVQAALGHAATVLEAYTKDPTRALSDVETALREWTESVATQAAKLDATDTNIRTQITTLDNEITTTAKQLANLDKRIDQPPIEGLLETFEPIHDKALLLYRNVEPKPGRESEARLLEAYLGPERVSAVIPLQSEDTERIRARIHPALPQVHVVERSELDADTPAPANSLLACLDATTTHPLAWAYLSHLVGDVKLLDVGQPRGNEARVVWRDGTVFDGKAWHLERIPDEVQHLSPTAAKKRLERLRTETENALKALEEARDTLRRELGEVNSSRTTLKRVKADFLADQNQLQFAQRRESIMRIDATLTENKSTQDDIQKTRHTQQELIQQDEESLTRVRETIKAKGHRERAEKLQGLRDAKADADKTFEKLLVQIGGQMEQESANTTKALERESEHSHKQESIAAIRIRLLPVARAAGYKDADLGDFMKKHVETAFELDKLDETRGKTENEEKRAIATVMAQVDELNRKMLLKYDDGEANEVIDLTTKETLSQILVNLASQVTSKTEERFREVQRFASQMVVRGIVEHIKADLDLMKHLVDDVNAQMEDHPWNGSTFRIKTTLWESKATPDDEKRSRDVARFHTLVKNFSLENQQELIEFITAHVKESSVDQGRVPSLFNYKQWFSFGLVRTQGGKEREMRDFLDKASGGGRTVPHYVLAFSLFKVLYDRTGSRIRTVLIDEAFRGADSASIDVLIGFAKSMGLDLIIANTELTGRTTSMDKSTVLMFTKDPKSHVTWIRPLTQEPLVPTR